MQTVRTAAHREPAELNSGCEPPLMDGEGTQGRLARRREVGSVGAQALHCATAPEAHGGTEFLQVAAAIHAHLGHFVAR